MYNLVLMFPDDLPERASPSSERSMYTRGNEGGWDTTLRLILETD